MNNFVLGQYIPKNTIIHRLDPRIKFLGLIVLITAIFIKGYWESFTYVSIFVVILFILAQAPPRIIISIFKSLIFMGIFLFIINMFAISSSHQEVLVNWSFIKITSKTITITAYIISRIVIMMFLTFILTMTTKPLDLTIAIEDLLKPLRIVKFPSSIIAMIISIALRFIPTLIDETLRIMKAQASRGVDFKHGKIKEKMKALTALIIPLFVSSFQKANDLSNAMEARGYNPYGKRTRYHQFKIKLFDIFAFLLVLGLLSLVIVTSIIPELQWMHAGDNSSWSPYA
ncbi:energy-coupling factor transporter transmembrane component T family protein [Mycoplasma sp. (ex Biomphalaria glabrata)]|uniref:energy-coupling factor transporter transmembrane component T family protein n=1 Tax=Mycoplasma sp. (ex Biomphalaria glabrata) TaxID=1749074 RepID=UPI000A116596|nr:energy-coupling factor transporter transmembrane component T [Mycoplasma sp. (ex Biomphalaria glabrata)]